MRKIKVNDKYVALNVHSETVFVNFVSKSSHNRMLIVHCSMLALCL